MPNAVIGGMKRSKKLALALSCGLCAPLAGCIGHSRVTAVASAEVDAPRPPQLVSLGAGVWVIEDHPEPVYFHAEQYWVLRGGVWYQSHVHTGGWVRVAAAPSVIVRVHRPQKHVHYHAPRTVERRTVVVVRDGDDGYDEGYRQGHEDGYKKGKKKGYKKGKKKGYKKKGPKKQAHKHGKKKGYKKKGKDKKYEEGSYKHGKKKGYKKKGKKSKKGSRD